MRSHRYFVQFVVKFEVNPQESFVGAQEVERQPLSPMEAPRGPRPSLSAAACLALVAWEPRFWRGPCAPGGEALGLGTSGLPPARRAGSSCRSGHLPAFQAHRPGLDGEDQVGVDAWLSLMVSKTRKANISSSGTQLYMGNGSDFWSVYQRQLSPD